MVAIACSMLVERLEEDTGRAKGRSTAKFEGGAKNKRGEGRPEILEVVGSCAAAAVAPVT